MKLHILGSAAAEGWPAMWCKCANCQKARAAGGKNIRSRSGAIVDDVIKLDLCPDTYMQALRDGVDLAQVTDVLITHAHADHFTPEELQYVRPPFGLDNSGIDVWGSAAVNKWIDKVLDSRLTGLLRPHTLQPLQPVTLADGAHVMPLPANHNPQTGPLNFIIRRNGKTLFYGLDSGWYPEEAWQAHAAYRFDIVLLDSTAGAVDPGTMHGNVDLCLRTRERMLSMGTADSDTIFIANHFSHNGGLLHAELEDRVKGTGMLIGYDGMVVEV